MQMIKIIDKGVGTKGGSGAFLIHNRKEGVCMVKCRDILRMKLDGMWLLAGEGGLDRVVSWF